MNKMFYIANWKMNINTEQSDNFFRNFIKGYKKTNDKEIVFCPSFTTLVHSLGASKSRGFSNVDKINIYFGAQNVSDKAYGAYTGEISANMLKDLSLQYGSNFKYCIVGHSERRLIFNESNKKR